MISWSNLESDIKLKKASGFLSRLSLLDAIFIATKAHRELMIVLDDQCLININKHLMISRNELGGLLVGNIYMDDISGDVSVIQILQHIPSGDFDSTGVSLRMESNIWNIARIAIEKSGVMVVGWYHSHPNLGAFFSGTDRRTQKHVFNHKYSVGLVIDPIRNEKKWFVGPDCNELMNDRVVRMNSILSN